MNVFQKLKASLRLREAVKKAEDAHCQTGERYYVMPLSGSKGKLIIMDRFNFRKLKQKGYISYDAHVRDLETECFYFTAYRNGTCGIVPEVENLKRQQFYHWYAGCIRNHKKKKRHEVHSQK
ncbi:MULTISPECIES: hypothetical protein [Mediterranea]|uniref:hypothetical protein n=1 Tax=Mediterranea TaxID=1926659 RepID=UPI002012685C|nr:MULTISPECIES: hypothetical protein [Mediterranea]MCL1606693.1 hypothetical protein [Mediterranea sp. ET5]MDM8122739.1 hypothetical protein [Mediterranea massiliensis]MDM8197195.1 hypothetical protein [Mediterranea massiliensis]